jgi:hypothetical protein
MSKINVRSPYHIYHTIANLTSATLDLYIYTGTQTSSRPAVTYSLTSTAYNASVTFEISELVRDYLDVTFAGAYVSQMVWVDYQITEYVSAVAQTPLTIVQLSALMDMVILKMVLIRKIQADKLQSNSIIYKNDDSPARIPVLSDGAKTIKFFNNGVEVYTTTLSALVVSSTIIKYISDAGDGIDSYKERVIADGGTYEDSACLQAFLDTLDIFPVDTIHIITASGLEIIKVKTIEECKHTPYKITFVNKFGALQDLWFFKRTDTKLNTSDNKYKSNILSGGTYSSSSHQNRILNKQGQETLTLNTGFYAEEYNEVFRQLMLSEKVWIEMDSVTLPINISSSSMAFKTVLNDKLISYTIDADFAYDKINSVR